jgi:hypothetical protein
MVFWRKHSKHAFTLPEFAIALAVVFVLIVLAVVGIPKAKSRAQQFKCFSNLKSTAFSFKMFAGDNGQSFPFGVTNSVAYQDSSNAWVHFQTLSNELGSARILMCPADVTRQRSTALTFGAAAGGLATLQNQAVSYFVNVDASETNGSMVLIGDRNLLLNGQTPKNTSLTLAGTNLLQWDREVHGFQGSAALADGSVHSVRSISVWTNHNNPVRLAIP